MPCLLSIIRSKTHQNTCLYNICSLGLIVTETDKKLIKQAILIYHDAFLSNILDVSFGVFTASPAIGSHLGNMQIRLINLYIALLFI